MRKLLVALAALMLAPGAFAQNVKIGIVAFISGPAAAPFGVPAKNAADFVVDELNAGKVAAPYGKKGFGGATLETVIVDEAGTTTTQVTEFRNLVQKHNVDLVIGYISSGNCLAIAPVAEELKKFTNFFDCGTPRIFEDGSYKYVFRTSPTACSSASPDGGDDTNPAAPSATACDPSSSCASGAIAYTAIPGHAAVR